jgi:hypothetical protein
VLSGKLVSICIRRRDSFRLRERIVVVSESQVPASRSGVHAWGYIVGLVIVVTVVIALFSGLGGNTHNSASEGGTAGPPTWRVIVRSSFPTIQSVNTPVTLTINAANRGPGIPHLVLDFQGLESYVINSIAGCNGPALAINGAGNPYDFGPLPSRKSCAITLSLVPHTPGNRTLSVTIYHSVSNGSIDTNSEVVNPHTSVRWHFKIRSAP